MNNKFISHRSGHWKVQDQGGGRLSIWWEPIDILHCVLTGQKGQGSFLGSFLIRILIPFMRVPPHDVITSQKTPSHWGLGFQHKIFGDIHLVYNIADNVCMSPLRAGFTNFCSSSLPHSHEDEVRGKVHSDPANHLNTALTKWWAIP